MMLRVLILTSITLMPIIFMSGAIIGKYHIKKMAREGGEKRYPEFIRNAVEKYREDNKYLLQEYPWDND